MLAIHEYTTDFTGQERRKAWTVYSDNYPATRAFYTLKEAINAVQALMNATHPNLWNTLVKEVWEDGKRVAWSVTLLNGDNDWKESQIEFTRQS